MRRIASYDVSTPRSAAWTARLIATVLVALALACVHAAAASAASAGYHSPGYAGKTDFGAKVTPKALPPIVLGTGKYPDLLVDAAGTAHVVFAHDGGTSAADTYSVLQSPARDQEVRDQPDGAGADGA